MTRPALVTLAGGVIGFTAAGFAAERVTGLPHLDMALAATGVCVTAVVFGSGVERLATRVGTNAVVPGYFVGVGTRGLLAIAGASLLATQVFSASDREACLLWVLAAYLAVLVFETVRAVRAADRATLAISERVEGPNE